MFEVLSINQNDRLIDWPSVVQSPSLAHLNSYPLDPQGFHLQLDGVLLSPLGWLSCLTSCSAWRHGNQGLQDHWNLSRRSWVDGPVTSPSPTGRWSLSLRLPHFCFFQKWGGRGFYPQPSPSPTLSAGHKWFTKQPPAGETAQIQNHCSPPLIFFSLLLLVEPPFTLSSIAFFKILKGLQVFVGL